jgi:hypothetical protein
MTGDHDPTSAKPATTANLGPAGELARRWRDGRPPALAGFVAEQGPLPPEQLADLVSVDQTERWRRGEHVPAETYLAELPTLAADTGHSLLVIYGEMLQRARRGEAPDLTEYVRRFPRFAPWLSVPLHLRTSFGPALPPPPESDAVPGVPAVPGYEVLCELGRGGMGVVYRARHLSLNRLVALKTIRTGPEAGPLELGRFRQEAETAAQLQHPNVVQVYEVGSHEGRAFLALEYVEGPSLAQHWAGQPQPPRAAAELLEVLARAVHYAHSRGVIHRDLKPANILLAEDRGGDAPRGGAPGAAGGVSPPG